MKRTLPIAITVLSILWMLTVVFFYFFQIESVPTCASNTICMEWGGSGYEINQRPSHGYYLESIGSSTSLNPVGNTPRINPVFGIVFTILLCYLLLMAYQAWYRNRKRLELKWSPFYFLLLFSGIFFLTAFNWFSFYDLLKSPANFTGIFGHFGLITGGVLLITLISIAVGAKLLLGINKKEKDAKKTENISFLETLLALGIGIMILIGILFLMGLFGILNSGAVWIVFIGMAAVCYKSVWHYIKVFFRRSIRLEMSFWDIRIWVSLIFLIFASHNLLELIRPMPIGFDDLALYMNVPKLLASTGHLLSGFDAYSWGLFMSLGFLLFQSTSLTLVLSFLGGVLVFFALYTIIKKYGEVREFDYETVQKYALLLATLFYTLPTVVFQSAKDMKVDLASMFFQLLAVSCWLLAYKKEGKELYKTALLSGLLLGFAFTIKYTALFFFIAMLVYILASHIKSKLSFKKIAITIFIFIIGFGLPFGPYAIKNVLESGRINLDSIRSGRLEIPSITIDPAFENKSETSIIQPPENTGIREELQRYIGYDDTWNKYLYLPLSLTWNDLTNGMYVDIGFLWLIFIPLFFLVLILLLQHQNKSRQIVVYFVVSGLTYWLLWLFLAQGVIWYGYSGFIFLIIGLLEFFIFTKKQEWHLLQYASRLMIIAWFISTLFLRTAFLPQSAVYIDRTGLAYARGIYDEKLYLDNKIRPYLQILERVNTDIRKDTKNPPFVYRVGTFIKYFIDQNNRTVFDDNQLDTFAFVHQDQDDLKTIERFKNSGFRYFIIDTNTATIDKTPEKSLTAKYNELIGFIQNNPDRIKIILNQPQNGILFAEIL